MSSSSLDQKLDGVGEDIVKGVKCSTIVKALSRLPQQQDGVEKWTHPSSGLNLLQLAVLHQRSNVVDYLCAQHKNFMANELYRKRTSTSSKTPEQNPPKSNLSQVLEDGTAGEQHTMTQPQMLRRRIVVVSLEQDEEYSGHCQKLVNHPLHMACWLGDLDCLKAMTKLVVDLERSRGLCQTSRPRNVVDSQAIAAKMRLMPLMKTVSVLTSNVASTEEAVEGLPMELAVDAGHIGCVVFMMRCILWPWQSSHFRLMCLDLDRKSKGTNLFLASCMSSPRLVAMLLAAQPEDLNRSDSLGQTPLHMAVWSGHTDTIRLLLEHGADVNAQTSYGCSCLHILFRTRMYPHTLEANLELLLSQVADIDAAGMSQRYEPETPLQTLMQEILDASMKYVVNQPQNPVLVTLAAFARSDRGESFGGTSEFYLQALVCCLRLLLKAGADPNALLSSAPHEEKLLQSALGTRSFLTQKYPTIMLSVMSTLLEFGATLCQNDADFQSLAHFFIFIIPLVVRDDKQASFVRLFCENGLDPDDLMRHVWSSLINMDKSAPWSLPVWTCLAHRMSVEALSILPVIHRNQDTSALSILPVIHRNQDNGPRTPIPVAVIKKLVLARHGSPVRSLMHCCKVAVRKALRHRGDRVAALTLPTTVKDYLKSEDE